MMKLVVFNTGWYEFRPGVASSVAGKIEIRDLDKLVSPQRPGQPPQALIYCLAAAAVLSVAALAYCYSHSMTNVYGDGVAHLNIARKVVDHPDGSLWQRYMQIGTPWLPLQTVLMLPLVANDWLWRTGLAGSAVSAASFVIAAAALYLLARHLYREEAVAYRQALPAISAAIFLLNPSALYMQTTPMTEMVFMCALVVAVYLLQRWATIQTTRRLVLAGIAMAVATLARYEAWPVAALAALLVFLISVGGIKTKIARAAGFSAVVMAGPLYWLWHNWAIYDNALEFLTGPYSARGIYLQNRANLGWSKIFVGNAGLDVVLMLVTVAACVGPLVMLLAAGGLARLIAARRRRFIEDAPALLLAVPFFFHVFSLYRGEIQIFPLSAFGLLNVRYGLPHLLATALFAPAAALALARLGRSRAMAVVCFTVAAQYCYLLSDGVSQLAVYQEGYRNGVNARSARERASASRLLRELRPSPMVLMHTGALGPLVPQGGLRFSGIIHEGTTRWHLISESIPADVRAIILQEGDPLDQKLRENPSLLKDVERQFREQYSTGKIKILERK